MTEPDSVEAVIQMLAQGGYYCDDDLAMGVFLAIKLGKPLFLEGEPGVGKTEMAKVLAQRLGRRLIRLQCYEGLDISTAVYEWNYAKQLLSLRLAGDAAPGREALEDVFGPEFLLSRPLLDAIRSESQGQRVVLLIDELDRADEEFEAFLLELLSDFQVTIPEMGTVGSDTVPLVILTSNRTREIHDAIKRRCLYHWIDYPSPEKELQIVRAKAPGIDERLARDICQFMNRLRQDDYLKRPGVAESLDWAQALVLLHRDHLDPEVVRQTKSCLFKNRQDLRRFQDGIAGYLGAGALE
ncbi:ATPase [Desulfocarbo indianensis]|nr:ATPase [Desulfocarbo indianensis]